MTETEKIVAQRYGTPQAADKKEESIADIIARAKKNAVKSTIENIDYSDIDTIKKIVYKNIENQCNFRNRKFMLTDEFSVATDKVVEWLCGGYLEYRWLLLSGSCGTGKTTVAKAILSVFAKQGQNYVEKSSYDIDILYKYVDNNKRASEEFNTLKSTPLLFIDDLGVEKNSDGIKEILYFRYNQMLVTIFTTNHSYSDLSSVYDARIFDRIEELTFSINFLGESFRRKK